MRSTGKLTWDEKAVTYVRSMGLPIMALEVVVLCDNQDNRELTWLTWLTRREVNIGASLRRFMLVKRKEEREERGERKIKDERVFVIPNY